MATVPRDKVTPLTSAARGEMPRLLAATGDFTITIVNSPTDRLDHPTFDLSQLDDV